MFVGNSADVKCDNMKNILFALMASCLISCKLPPKEVTITGATPTRNSGKSAINNMADSLNVQVGSTFFFGYSNSVSKFKVIDMNDKGIFAYHTPFSDWIEFFPYADLKSSQNFKVINH